MFERIDLTGKVFSYLTVISYLSTAREYSGNPSDTGAIWRCICVCGKEVSIRATSLKSESTKSCGCMKSHLSSLANVTHGLTKTPEYVTWRHMRERCNNTKHHAYDRYGGRGIAVCDRWGSFKLFLEDMGKRPSLSFTIDRKDNDAGYSPDNCCWASKSQQAINKSNTMMITSEITGETLCATDWSIKLNGAKTIVGKRIKAGWDEQVAITKPSQALLRKKKVF